MEKPIIATNLDGFLLKHSAFYEPHKKWFERAIEKTGDKSLRRWVGADPYFPGVNIAMEKILPNATPEQKTTQARIWYQEDVLQYIKEHPAVIIKENVKKLKKLKTKFRLILVTSNTEDYINKILQASKLEGIYDAVIASKTEQEPDKSELVKELIAKYRRPEYYITGKPDDKTTEQFRKLGTQIVTEDKIEELF